MKSPAAPPAARTPHRGGLDAQRRIFTPKQGRFLEPSTVVPYSSCDTLPLVMMRSACLRALLRRIMKSPAAVPPCPRAERHRKGERRMRPRLSAAAECAPDSPAKPDPWSAAPECIPRPQSPNPDGELHIVGYRKQQPNHPQARTAVTQQIGAGLGKHPLAWVCVFSQPIYILRLVLDEPTKPAWALRSSRSFQVQRELPRSLNRFLGEGTPRGVFCTSPGS